MSELRSQFYGNNKSIKKSEVVIEYTAHQVAEVLRCRDDILHFFRNYIYIISLDEGRVLFNPYPFQEKLVSACQSNRFNIFTLARQSGKCIRKDSKIRLKNKKTGEIFEENIEKIFESQKDMKSLTH